MDNRRKQLLYRANHRGIKEMDMLLGGYAQTHIANMSDADLDHLEALMEHSDRDLLKWFTGEEDAPDGVRNALFEAILSHQVSKISATRN